MTISALQSPSTSGYPSRTMPMQARTMQTTTLPMQTTSAQTGINIGDLMNLMLPMMIVVMMVKMMGKMIATDQKPIEAS